ncbi:amidohydrolase [Dasania marina]|uniref:amidohydrolase n=1 Tax=Dasania marina TaxID=471499 RepID=UPI00036192E9|nr:amidohydrolase family protein [Dasania marina]
MNKKITWAAVCITALLQACSQESEPESAQSNVADLVLTDGYIYTVDGQHSVAQAVAIQGNRIVGVGSNEEMRAFIGDNTDVRDLAGKMVMPGIHDTHVHAFGTVDPDMCDLGSEAYTLDDMVPFLKACLQHYAPEKGQWLPVVQWSFAGGNQPSERYPTLRSALDAVSKDNPIILWGDDGHHGAANSAALALASIEGKQLGISRETLATHFAQWRENIAVDQHGEPSGGVNEGARLLIRPQFTEDMLGSSSDPEALMPRIAAGMASRGITSIHDPLTSAETLSKYQWLEDSGQMSFRLRAGLFAHAENSHQPEALKQIPAIMAGFKDLRKQYQGSRYIQVNGIKLFADSVLEGNPLTHPPTLPGAAVLNGFKQPIFEMNKETGAVDVVGYADLNGTVCQQVRATPERFKKPAAIKAFNLANGHPPAQCFPSSGILEHSEAFILEYVKQATAAGFHVHIHALSDKGVRVAVDALAAVKTDADKQGLTQSLAHLQLVHPDDQRRIGELGLFNVFTYIWAGPFTDYNLMVIPFIEKVNGRDDLFNPDTYYMRNVYPAKAIKDAGGILTFGSDAPVESRDPRPFINMQLALTRAAEGKVLNASQRLNIHEALQAFTLNGAKMLSQDKDVGSIEQGKLADLIVLDRNLVQLAEQDKAEKIGETQVLLTIFDGRVVYQAEK